MVKVHSKAELKDGVVRFDVSDGEGARYAPELPLAAAQRLVDVGAQVAAQVKPEAPGGPVVVDLSGDGLAYVQTLPAAVVVAAAGLVRELLAG